jgi:arginine/lysine/histidine/glutamine transport system substrate-binding/permease protein
MAIVRKLAKPPTVGETMTQRSRVWWRWFGITLSGLLLIMSSAANAASKTLIVAVEPVFPPFEFRSPDGSLQGFDVDLINAVGKAANFDVQFQSIPFDGIIPALQAGTVDAAVAAMTITPERARTVSFSRPYFKAGLAIATTKANQSIRSLDDLQGKAIAVQSCANFAPCYFPSSITPHVAAVGK